MGLSAGTLENRLDDAAPRITVFRGLCTHCLGSIRSSTPDRAVRRVALNIADLEAQEALCTRVHFLARTS